MNRYDAGPVLAGLKDFQRAAVDHVMDRWFGTDPTSRFLVADETGLGKSVVARGVIAALNERLQDDPSVKRVDVIYVCSNQDIAAQNLSRLRVGGEQSIALTSRLTMMASHAQRLRQATATAGKPLNLVAFTPATSFDRGWRTGKAEERALLYLLLESGYQWDGWQTKAAKLALRGSVRNAENFQRVIDTEIYWANKRGGMDTQIRRSFLSGARKAGLLRTWEGLLDDIGRKTALSGELWERAADLIGRMRSELARAGLDVLEPDLVILDEFQRFRHVLDVTEGGEAAELAHALFDYPGSRVLLLSATPYKPYTLADESDAGDDHHRDFRRVLRFLNADPTWNEEVTASFDAYRDDLVAGRDTQMRCAELRELLLQVMTRTERPREVQQRMRTERVQSASDLRPDDLRGYTALYDVAAHLQAPVTIEYWKSAPYFVNFTDGYQLGQRIRDALSRAPDDPELRGRLRATQRLDAAALRRYAPLDPGNARLRRLAEDTVGAGWWRLLWMPPSMPHYALRDPFRSAAAAGITKRLVFSSWTAAPTAIAGILSYEAERHLAAGRLESNSAAARKRIGPRLDYRMESGRPGGMSTLALFWPHPDLAAACDPLAAARREPDQTPTLRGLTAALHAQLMSGAPADLQNEGHTGETHAWAALLRWPGAGLPEGLGADEAAGAMSGDSAAAHEDEAPDPTRLSRHVELAVQVTSAQDYPAAREPAAVMDDLVAIGMHGPANVAWRALGRLLDARAEVSPAGHWTAAAILASAFRSLFNRTESILLLDELIPNHVYWRAVLRYCAAGGLQAVLDEYLHHLNAGSEGQVLDDERLEALAVRAAAAITLRPAVYRAFDPSRPDTAISLPGRFALRYGGRAGDTESARAPEVREAFNSPFWPFLLATTSAGQEGIDFHWWCSAIVHWNLPANPVDFEQREGRVHRFGGHAVRRNIAAEHRAAALRSGGPDVWAAAYEAAAKASAGALGDFAPYWVYPGAACIERHLLPYPLSRDEVRLTRLKQELALYRLAFGQPRQEDLVELLRRNNLTPDDAQRAGLNLAPPVLEG